MIKIIDSEFAHATTVGNGGLDFNPQHFNWYRGDEYRDITVYTDRHIYDRLVPSKYNIAWLIEPKEINPFSYEYIRQNINKFDFIFTHDCDLCQQYSNCILLPLAGCWIERNDQKIYDKSKCVSIIASNKRMTYGHRLRHEVISNLSEKIDMICGNGYVSIPKKIEALKDFRYSIVIENVKSGVFFTEKLIDCFMTGTVPIYYGTEKLDFYFNRLGIIEICSLQDLSDVLDYINENDYLNRLKFIHENFELSKKFVVTEDYMYDILFKNLLEGLK